MHGSGARAAFPQRRFRLYQRSGRARRRPPDLLGLTLLGVSLPTDPAGRLVPLWQDVIAAGVAVASYSMFFLSSLSATLGGRGRYAGPRFKVVVLNVLGFGVAIGALVACTVVGLVLTPDGNHAALGAGLAGG